ncbi:uncharacterized protein [Vulpes vulpes]|uniref:Translation initiation factor IF-2-like n=1 Tax=Vulpes vulpes TaxID=9627 RepID=A0ABM4YLX0_VULVU
MATARAPWQRARGWKGEWPEPGRGRGAARCPLPGGAQSGLGGRQPGGWETPRLGRRSVRVFTWVTRKAAPPRPGPGAGAVVSGSLRDTPTPTPTPGTGANHARPRARCALRSRPAEHGRGAASRTPGLSPSVSAGTGARRPGWRGGLSRLRGARGAGTPPGARSLRSAGAGGAQPGPRTPDPDPAGRRGGGQGAAGPGGHFESEERPQDGCVGTRNNFDLRNQHSSNLLRFLCNIGHIPESEDREKRSRSPGGRV